MRTAKLTIEQGEPKEIQFLEGPSYDVEQNFWLPLEFEGDISTGHYEDALLEFKTDLFMMTDVNVTHKAGKLIAIFSKLYPVSDDGAFTKPAVAIP